MRYSDSPILRPDQDVLGRRGFALELARAIDRLAVTARDGFVIAIHGEWGSGKTSVIELVVRYLRHIEMERASQVPILNDRGANPRTIAELEAMSSSFEVLEHHVKAMEAVNKNVTYWQKLNRVDQFRRWSASDEAAQDADRYFELKLRVDANPRTIVQRLSPWLIAGRVEIAQALLSELARALGEVLGDNVKEAFAAVLQRLSEFAPIVGAALDVASAGAVGKLITVGGSWSSKVAATMASGATLDQLRERLRGILRALDNKQVLVVVDDLGSTSHPPRHLRWYRL